MTLPGSRPVILMWSSVWWRSSHWNFILGTKSMHKIMATLRFAFVSVRMQWIRKQTSPRQTQPREEYSMSTYTRNTNALDTKAVASGLSVARMSTGIPTKHAIKDPASAYPMYLKAKYRSKQKETRVSRSTSPRPCVQLTLIQQIHCSVFVHASIDKAQTGASQC